MTKPNESDFYIPKNLAEIYKKLAADHNLPEATVKNIVAHEFRQVRKIVINCEYPSVYLKNLGTFETFISLIYKTIDLWILAYRRGSISHKQLEYRVGQLWSLRNKMIELDGKVRIPSLQRYLPRKNRRRRD